MNRLADKIKNKQFVITGELNPPKGIDLESLFKKAEGLKGCVDAINLTDSAGSNMSMAPIAVAKLMEDKGTESILQVTCRDRNRIAIQSELLGASALGISNILCMSGDPPSGGDHPDSKPVFDIDAVQLLNVIDSLNAGSDMSGNKLNESTDLFAGAVVNPGSEDLDKELARMEQKIEAGASFFQSQGIFDVKLFEKFMESANRFNVPVLAGIIVVKSGNMARYLNSNLPGVTVPDEIIDDLESSKDRVESSVKIAGRIIRDVSSLCSGVHIMAIGWESRIPSIVSEAGLKE